MLVMSYGYCSSLKLALPYLYVCVIDFGHSDIDKYDIPVFSHSWLWEFNPVIAFLEWYFSMTYLA